MGLILQFSKIIKVDNRKDVKEHKKKQRQKNNQLCEDLLENQPKFEYNMSKIGEKNLLNIYCRLNMAKQYRDE